MSTFPSPIVHAFYEPHTSSVQYVVGCPATGECAVLDAVLDFDEKSGTISTASADAILADVKANGWRVQWILDTHPHADHLSAAHYLHSQTGAPTCIGRAITKVQALWKRIYNLPDLPADGSQWDRLFADGEVFLIGEMESRVRHSPGHTLASITYEVGDAAFVHDTLLMPDNGTARADFPGGDAAALWRSIATIMALPDATRLFTGHDYQPGDREPMWESTVAEQRRCNIHLNQAATETEFVTLRQQRDRTLALPQLMLHALQVNIRGGRLPEPEDGRHFLKYPLNAFASAVW